MESLKARLEAVLEMSVDVGQPLTLKALPGFLRQRYLLTPVSVAGGRWLAVELLDVDDFTPLKFEKHLAHLTPVMGEEYQGYCLIADALPPYVLPRLVSRHIPFVAAGRRVFWPALGVHYRHRAQRVSMPATARRALTPAAQVLFLYGLYHHAPGAAALQAAADATGYTPMTISRASDELEGHGLIRTEKRGGARFLCFDEKGGLLWQKASERLRNPVRKTLRVMQHDVAGAKPARAGESALATCSMLSAPAEPVVALGPAAWKERTPQVAPVPFEDDGTCLVQVWRYDPLVLAMNGQVDPCSLLLSFADNTDERLAIALDDFKEEFEWFKV